MPNKETVELTSRQKSTKKRYAELKSEIPPGHPRPAAKLRFPYIPKDLEYFDVIKNKRKIKTYKIEIAGMNWREFGEKIFNDGVPAGTYSYGLKFLKNPYIYRGFISSVDPEGSPAVNDQSESIKQIKDTIEGLTSSLKSKTSESGLSIDYVIQSMQRSHEAEISIYKLEITNLKEKIAELKSEINELDSELDKAEGIIAQLKEKSSSNNLTETIVGLISQVTGKSNPTLNPIKE
jgi:hypothetical protein